jgi:hypothetical protein
MDACFHMCAYITQSLLYSCIIRNVHDDYGPNPIQMRQSSQYVELKYATDSFCLSLHVGCVLFIERNASHLRDGH